MNLKKINPNLQKALSEIGYVDATEVQQETFSVVKSGADCVICSPTGSGKTTALLLNIVQKLQKAEGESTRAVLIVREKEDVLEAVSEFERLATYTDLRVLGVHEKGDIDYDKNQISLGLDLLIGTPLKINALFSSAGFNLNTVRFLAVDDAEVIFKNRQDAIILRLAESIAKTQYVFACEEITERVEILADKIMAEPLFFEPDEDEPEEE